MDNFDPNKTPKKQVLSAQIDLSKFERRRKTKSGSRTS